MNQKLCEEIIGRMKLTAPVFGDSIVQVNHEDGTALTFRHALAWRYGEWLLVASEHNGYHYFHTGDLAFWGFFKGQKIQHVDVEGETCSGGHCDYCFNEVSLKLLKLAPIPNEEIDLCPACYADYENGKIDPTKEDDKEE